MKCAHWLGLRSDVKHITAAPAPEVEPVCTHPHFSLAFTSSSADHERVPTCTLSLLESSSCLPPASSNKQAQRPTFGKPRNTAGWKEGPGAAPLSFHVLPNVLVFFLHLFVEVVSMFLKVSLLLTFTIVSLLFSIFCLLLDFLFSRTVFCFLLFCSFFGNFVFSSHLPFIGCGTITHPWAGATLSLPPSRPPSLGNGGAFSALLFFWVVVLSPLSLFQWCCLRAVTLSPVGWWGLRPASGDHVVELK